MRKEGTLSKVYSEEYCCMYGYLGLCKARGESAEGMAQNLNIPGRTIRYHLLKLKQGKHACLEKPNCLAETISAIEKAP